MIVGAKSFDIVDAREIVYERFRDVFTGVYATPTRARFLLFMFYFMKRNLYILWTFDNVKYYFIYVCGAF